MLRIVRAYVGGIQAHTDTVAAQILTVEFLDCAFSIVARQIFEDPERLSDIMTH